MKVLLLPNLDMWFLGLWKQVVGKTWENLEMWTRKTLQEGLEAPQMTQAIAIALAAHHNQKVRPTAEDTTHFRLEHREIWN